MPRYYFHVRRGQVTVLDHEGLRLADSAGMPISRTIDDVSARDGVAQRTRPLRPEYHV
jgi:hypothetical protein